MTHASSQNSNSEHPLLTSSPAAAPLFGQRAQPANFCSDLHQEKSAAPCWEAAASQPTRLGRPGQAAKPQPLLRSGSLPVCLAWRPWRLSSRTLSAGSTLLSMGSMH